MRLLLRAILMLMGLSLLAPAGGCDKKSAPLPTLSLHDAARLGRVEELKLHVAWKADLTRTDRDGYTPLGLAIINGHADAVRYLSEQGDSAVSSDGKQRTPLQSALIKPDVQIVGLLLDKGADANTKLPSGQTPLHLAISQNDLALVRLLLSKGAAAGALDAEGRPPLHLAVAQSSAAMVQAMLAAKAPVNQVDAAGNPALVLALEGATSGTMRGSGDSTTRSADAYEPIVKLLLDNGADPNLPGAGGRLPLHQAITAGSEPMVQLLLGKGAKANVAAVTVDPPLQVAVAQGSVQMVQTLLAAGADVKAQNAKRQTALHVAAAKGLPAAVQLLLARGADSRQTDSGGKSPSDLVSEASDAGAEVRALLGALPVARLAADLRMHEAVRRHDVAAVKAAPAAAALATDGAGRTPLHVAVGWVFWDERPESVSRNMEMLKAVAAQSGAAQLKDARDKTPLVTAIAGLDFARQWWPAARQPEAGKAFAQVVAVLIEHGADVNQPDSRGMTPLHHAAALRVRQAIAVLLQAKANPRLRDQYSRTALDLARDGGDAECINLLREQAGDPR